MMSEHLRAGSMVVMIAMLFGAIGMSAQVMESGSFYNFLFNHEPNCVYDHWVSHLSEGIAEPGFNDYAPWDRQTNGFGRFANPDTAQIAIWNQVCAAYVAQNWAAVDQILGINHLPYELVQFQDNDNGQIYYILRENLNQDVDDNGTPEPEDDETGSFNLGWGLYVYNPASTHPIIITVPHPCDDYIAPVIAWKAFTTLNARYLLINGAGREVLYNTSFGYYSNSFSLSDPSRNANHPMQLAYVQFCNNIRSLLASQGSPLQREFSLQVHSYDSNLHIGFANLQVSAGSGQTCVNLPTFDLSYTQPDMINEAGYLIHPAGSLGNAEDVLTTDYWAVYSSQHPVIYNDGEHYLAISNMIDLPAYAANRQMQYTLANWNNYDVYDPFLHVEMDELPDCYPQNQESARFFYGWNDANGLWELDNRWTLTLAYYSPFVNALQSSLQRTLIMNDNTPPETPPIISHHTDNFNNLYLNWQRVFDYDFASYAVKIRMYREEAGGNLSLVSTTIYNRNNIPILADQGYNSSYITTLMGGYMFRINLAAYDKSSRWSAWSDSLEFSLQVIVPAVTDLTYLRELSDNDLITLAWTPLHAGIGVTGYRLERRHPFSDWESMAILDVNTGSYMDTSFGDGDEELFYYRLASLGADGSIVYGPDECSAWLRAFSEPLIIGFELRDNGHAYLEWEPVRTTLGGVDDVPDFYEIAQSDTPSFDSDSTRYYQIGETSFLDENPELEVWQQRCFYRIRALANPVPVH